MASETQRPGLAAHRDPGEAPLSVGATMDQQCPGGVPGASLLLSPLCVSQSLSRPSLSLDAFSAARPTTPTRRRKAACSFSVREKQADCATRLCVWPVGRGAATNWGAGLPFKKEGENQGADEGSQDHQRVDKDGAGFPFFGAWRRERGTRQVTSWSDVSTQTWSPGSPRPPLLRSMLTHKNGPVSVSTPDVGSALRRP